MIDKNYRNERIRDLAERIFFAGLYKNFQLKNAPAVDAETVFRFAETFVDHSILAYRITEDECKDEPSSPPVQDSL